MNSFLCNFNIVLFLELENQLFSNLVLKTNFKMAQLFELLMEKPINIAINELDKFILDFNDEFLEFIKKNKSAFQIYNCSIDMQLAHLKFITYFFDYKNGIISELTSFKDRIFETTLDSFRDRDIYFRELSDSYL
jgi:hypothetical protein